MSLDFDHVYVHPQTYRYVDRLEGAERERAVRLVKRAVATSRAELGLVPRVARDDGRLWCGCPVGALVTDPRGVEYCGACSVETP